MSNRDTIGSQARLDRIVAHIQLAENFKVLVDQDKEFFDADGVPSGRFYFQVWHYRKDVITGEWGWGHGGKAYVSPHASDSELVQTVFGLYKGFWEHEARETFKWRGRRVFGPHIDTDALWEVATKVDVRKPMPEQKPEPAEERGGMNFDPSQVL